MDKIFEPILDKNENIIEIIKPNKKMVFLSSFISSFLILLIMFAIGCVPFFVTGEVEVMWIFIPIIIFIVLEALIMMFTAFYYNKTFFAYTNKRVIVRTGIIGADFRSLDIKMIGAIDVEVGLLDKLIHQNTGSIRFGSMSSPINNQTGGGVVFASITNPYETYKKIKEYIEESKSNS